LGFIAQESRDGAEWDPGNVVEELEAELLHGEADGMDDVGGAGNPDGAVWLEDALAGGEPGAVKLVIGVGTAGFVPIAFVDADHASGVAGDAAVGEEVGRVGEDEVDGGFGDKGKQFEAVALVDAEVVLGVVEGGSGERHGLILVNQGGSLIKEAIESSTRWCPERSTDSAALTAGASSRRQIVDQKSKCVKREAAEIRN
jgi:hypothetical protein